MQAVKLSDAERLAKYKEHRGRNNEACKRSRAKHKQETKDMQEELVHLKQMNAELQRRVMELERKSARQRLIE